RWISGSITPVSASWIWATRSSPAVCPASDCSDVVTVCFTPSMSWGRPRPCGDPAPPRPPRAGGRAGPRHPGRAAPRAPRAGRAARRARSRGWRRRSGPAQGGDLPGDEVGGGVVALVGLAILLGLHAIAVVLTVLGEQQQGSGVGGLQREDQRQQG